MAEAAMPCRAYTAKSQTAGKGMFASEDIEAGEAVFSRVVSHTALNTTRLDKTCANCFLSNEDECDSIVSLSTCSGCGTLRYCSKQCQVEAWNHMHKYECKLLRKFPKRGPIPDAVRVVLQMTRDHKQWAESPLSSMTSHIDNMVSQNDERYEYLLTLSTGLHHYIKASMPVEFIQLCFALCFTNSLTIWTPTFDSLGICVDPFVACANHSCDPNAVSVWDGSRLSFRTLRSIKKDDEIFIAYIDITNEKPRRQSELNARYYFNCSCGRCSATDPAPDLPQPKDQTEQLAILRQSKLDAAAAFGSSDDFATHLFNVDPGGSGLLHEVQQLGFAASTAAKNAARPLTLVCVALKSCLRIAPWPLDRQPIALLLQERFVILLQLQKFVRAFYDGLLLYFYVWPASYPLSFHPQHVAHKWTLARLCTFIASEKDDKDVQALRLGDGLDFGLIVGGLLLEIEGNVDRSHGSSSSFARTVRRKLQEVRMELSLVCEQPVLNEKAITEQWTVLRRIAADRKATLAAWSIDR